MFLVCVVCGQKVTQGHAFRHLRQGQGHGFRRLRQGLGFVCRLNAHLDGQSLGPGFRVSQGQG